ncbi:uncharacterized protein [Diadema antillarum]|uniref:uncharacterized protein n=1 Tax=Diadema antillarum TaxID=105358 RepID=UPI003A846FCC
MMETQRDLEHQLEQAQREAREAQAELMKMKVSQEFKKAFNDDGSANETSCSGCVPESSFDSTNSDDDLPGLSKSREKRQESMHGLDLEMTNNMKRTLGNDSSSANETSGSEWLPDSSSDCTESDDEPPGMSKSRNETRDPHGESVQGLDKESSGQDAFQRDNVRWIGSSRARAKTGERVWDKVSDVTLWLVLTIGALLIGSSLKCGYNYGNITPPSIFIKDFYNETNIDRFGVPMSEEGEAWLWGTTTVVFCIGRAIGATAGSRWSKRYGSPSDKGEVV